ncbi:MAG: ketopantoate reductase family protein, partial [Promethearchaeota archaeon]
PLEIIFFGRRNHIDAINKEGLRLTTGDKDSFLKNIKGYESVNDFTESLEIGKAYKFDFLFLTTKAYDTESSMVQFKDLIESSNWFIILQNGVGNEALVKEYCNEDRILRIVTSHGALLENYGHVRHTGVGFTKIGFAYLKPDNNTINIEDYGRVEESLRLLKDLLSAAGLQTEIVDDIIKCSWEKVFVLTGLTNGQLLERNSLRELMRKAVEEALEVANAKQVDLSNRDYVELMYSVAKKTYNNKNSMLQDVLRGKPTEIDFINGRIVEFGKKLGIAVVTNELLTALIKGLESSF